MRSRHDRFEGEELRTRPHDRLRHLPPLPPPPASYYSPAGPRYGPVTRYSAFSLEEDLALETQLHHDRLRYEAELEDIHRARRRREEEDAIEELHRVRRLREEDEERRQARDSVRFTSRGRGRGSQSRCVGDNGPRLATSRRDVVRESFGRGGGRPPARGNRSSQLHDTGSTSRRGQASSSEAAPQQPPTLSAASCVVTPRENAQHPTAVTTATSSALPPAQRSDSSTRPTAPPAPAAPLLNLRVNNLNETLDSIARSLRDTVLQAGFHRTLITWPMTARYTALPVDVQVQSLEYLRWCRDLMLAFNRYGSRRTRTVLNNIELTTGFREGVWNQSRIFLEWLSRSLSRRGDQTQAEIVGWLPENRPHVDADDAMGDVSQPASVDSHECIERGRNERVRLLSLDGLSDPRRDRVGLDDDFAILHDLSEFGETFQANYPPSNSTTTAAELGAQQAIVFGLEGRFPLPSISSK